MKTEENQQRYQLIRKYHVICGKLGLTEEQRKDMLITAYSVESSKQLSLSQLIDLCDRLNREASPAEFAELDKWRKRVIAAIGSWLKSIGQPDDIDYIKAIACRSAGVDAFNRIPKARLNGIYNAFKNKQKDIKSVEDITTDLLRMFGLLN